MRGAVLMSAPKPTIMVVDADAAVREALWQALPDLLITDVRMEGYNGLQLAAMDVKGRIPVIVLTGHADAAIELEAERLGTTFLLKPVPSAVLLEAVAAKLFPP